MAEKTDEYYTGKSPAKEASTAGVKKATEDYDASHPDFQALKKEGVPEGRVAQLAKHHNVSHPAMQKPKVNVTNYDPNHGGVGLSTNATDPQEWAANVLIDAGLPDTKDNESLLQRQMQLEGMKSSYDNPLATSVPQPGSTSINSDNVQQYPNATEGQVAEAETLNQPNMMSIKDALESGKATPEQYAQALAGSDYEGNNPAANEAYAQSFLGDSPETSFPGGGSGQEPAAIAAQGGQAEAVAAGQQQAGQTLSDAASTNLFQGLTGVIPTLGTQSANSSLQSALAGLAQGSQATLNANTTNAPGSPDQPASQSQQTSVPSASQYQQLLAALLPNIRPGAAQ